MLLLYIDDHADQRNLVRRIMEHYGWRFIGANDGETGQREAEFEQPDIILVDFYISGNWGTTVVARLKTNARTAHIPIIGVSSGYGPNGRGMMLRAGCSECWDKPLGVWIIERLNAYV